MSNELTLIKEIKDINDITRETLKTPFIIRNFFSYELSESILSKYILSPENSNKEISTSRKNNSETRSFNFLEYISYMNSTVEDDPWYASNYKNTEIINNIMNHVNLPKVFGNWLDILPEEIKPLWLWIFLGPQSSSTKLHIDVMMSSAWNLLFSGSKEWRFLTPAKSIESNILNRSYSSYFNTDKFEIKTLQNPGDLVFTPSGWAHEVVNMSSTVSVTGNFVNESNYIFVKHFLVDRQKMDWLKVINKLESIYIGVDK